MAEDAHYEEEQVQEEEVYEDEIPMEADEGYDAGAGGNAAEELNAMKQKLKEMEEEAARLKALQSGGGEQSGAAGAGASGPSAQDIAAKEEADSRSIYIGNVDYSVTPEELQQHFQSCGTINRVTILTDRFGNPKGFAYVEFLEVDAVANALLLDNTELHGRAIKVMQKRTNVPGLKARGRGRGRGGFHGGGGRGGYYPPPYGRGGGRYGYGGGYGYAPRGRGRGRFYAPY